MAFFAPWGNQQFVTDDGSPASGWHLYSYLAGSSTPATTYCDEAGTIAQTNPIVLDTLGFVQSGQLWFAGGQAIKLVLTDENDVAQKTEDNLVGINDTSVTVSEWANGPTPTYISSTSFSVVGDQTGTLQVSRRVMTLNSGGTAYSTITSASFGGGITTVVVANSSGSIDAGLTTLSYSVVSADNSSIGADYVSKKGTAVVSAATTNIWAISGDFVHVTGNTGPITSLGTAPYAGAERTVIFDSTPTLTYNATTLQLPGGKNIVAAAGDRMLVRADTTANMIVVDYIKASASPGGTTPTRQVLTSGSGTYNTPTGAVSLRVRLVGGGAGGSGGPAGSAASTAGNSTFSTFTASGGVGSIGGSIGGAGGAASGGSVNIAGGSGGGAGITSVANVFMPGGMGGSSAFGGTGSGGVGNSSGGNAPANSGGGGGGGGGGSAQNSGTGGGSGGYCEGYIAAPAATYSYAVGAGTSGTAGATTTGGNGAAGIIIVEEFYV